MIDKYECFFDILNFIRVFAYLVLFKSIADNISFSRCSSKIIYIMILIFSIVGFIFEVKHPTLIILVCTIIYIVNYEENILKCIIISFISWFVIYLPMKYIASYFIFEINYNYILNRPEVSNITSTMETLIIQITLMLFLIQTLIQIKKLKEVCGEYNKKNYILIGIPVLITILIIILSFRVVAFDETLSEFYMTILISIPILVLIAKAYIFNTMKIKIENYKLEYENKVIKDNVSKEYNYYLEINKEKDKVKSLYHDMNNHLICIRYLIEDENTKKVIEYIDSMESNIQNYKRINQEFNTGNMILDSILRVKKSVCIDKGIDFEIDVDFSKSDFMDMVDVCIIFSNLIDNAIEACNNIESINVIKSINLKSNYINKFCVVTIENSSINNIRRDKNIFISSKENTNMHGIGLRNVDKVIKKYFGELNINYDKESFSVTIVIPLEL